MFSRRWIVILILLCLPLSGYATFFDKFKDGISKIIPSSRISAKQRALFKAININQVKDKLIRPVGYSLKFNDKREKISTGLAKSVYYAEINQIEEKAKKLKKGVQIDTLTLMEQGVLALNISKLNEAREYFSKAETQIKFSLQSKDKKSSVGKFFGKIGGAGKSLTGLSHTGQYRPEFYERVMIQNYLTVIDLLQGRLKDARVRAVNTTSFQIAEEKRYYQFLHQERLEKEEKLKEEGRSKKSKIIKRFNLFSGLELFPIIKRQYKDSKSKAFSVPSAFANPYGNYMAALGFDLYGDRNGYKFEKKAFAHYQQVKKLNPSIATEVEKTKEYFGRKAPLGKRRVSIVAASGFAPERNVLSFHIPIGKVFSAIKLPIYRKVYNPVSHIEVRTIKGNLLARVSELADIDALAFRREYDNLQKQHKDLLMRMASSAAITSLVGKVAIVANELINPDMRSWLSLPSKISIANIEVPFSQSEIQIISYDKNDKALSRKIITLPQAGHANKVGFAYVRAVNNAMYINYSFKI